MTAVKHPVDSLTRFRFELLLVRCREVKLLVVHGVEHLPTSEKEKEGKELRAVAMN